MTRQLLLVGGLALALLAVYQLSRAAAGWQYLVSGDAATVLYATGFDDASTLWEPADDGLRLAQIDPAAGSLRLHLEEINDSVYAPLRWHFTDFDLRVTMTAVDGPENNGYGVLFRQTDARNYYYFLISSDGYYRLTRVLDGIAKDLSTWIPSDVIQTGMGAVNQIRVTGEGGDYRFYINETPVALCIPDDPDAASTYDEFAGECQQGQMLETLTDPALASGRVGVIAITLNEPESTIQVDQVVIYGG